MKSITFRYAKTLPSEKSVDRLPSVVMLLPSEIDSKLWRNIPFGERIKAQLKQRKAPCKPGDLETVDLPNRTATQVLLIFLPKEQNAFQRLTLARKAVKMALAVKPKTLAVFCGDEKDENAPLCSALTSAALAACAELPSYKSSKPPTVALERIAYYGLTQRLDTNRLLAEAGGNELARRLTMEPANKLTPALYRNKITQLARKHRWRMTFLDIQALKRKKAGAFVAVTQGSTTRDAGIVHLQYRPAKSRGKNVTLVGKGICFDTGGVNVKTARYMQEMNEDMAGSAVALGVLQALTEMRVDFPVDCWLALAQNHIGPDAYKPSDVVTASNGTTIEVVHSDAEGRMVLADTLALASRSKPGIMIDYATLTGACVYALSSRYSGVFSNRDALLSPLMDAGRQSGERIWPFPIDEDFDGPLESAIADVKQCALEGEADHIIAARFLQRFVNDVPWIHVDLASGRHRGGLAHVPTDTTGFGVRYTLELLLGDYLSGL